MLFAHIEAACPLKVRDQNVQHGVLEDLGRAQLAYLLLVADELREDDPGCPVG